MVDPYKAVADPISRSKHTRLNILDHHQKDTAHLEIMVLLNKVALRTNGAHLIKLALLKVNPLFRPTINTTSNKTNINNNEVDIKTKHSDKFTNRFFCLPFNCPKYISINMIIMKAN